MKTFFYELLVFCTEEDGSYGSDQVLEEVEADNDNEADAKIASIWGERLISSRLLGTDAEEFAPYLTMKPIYTDDLPF